MTEAEQQAATEAFREQVLAALDTGITVAVIAFVLILFVLGIVAVKSL